jgi:hypothetical protein
MICPLDNLMLFSMFLDMGSIISMGSVSRKICEAMKTTPMIFMPSQKQNHPHPVGLFASWSNGDLAFDEEAVLLGISNCTQQEPKKSTSQFDAYL